MDEKEFKKVEKRIEEVEFAVLAIGLALYEMFYENAFVEKGLKDYNTIKQVSSTKFLENTHLGVASDRVVDEMFDRIKRDINRKGYDFVKTLNDSLDRPLSNKQLKDTYNDVRRNLYNGEIIIAIPRPMTGSRSDSIMLSQAEKKSYYDTLLGGMKDPKKYRDVIKLSKMETFTQMQNKFKLLARQRIKEAVSNALRGAKDMNDLDRRLKRQLTNVFGDTQLGHGPLPLPLKAASTTSFILSRFINELNREILKRSGAKYAYYRTQRDDHVCDKCQTLEDNIDTDVATELKDESIDLHGLYKINDIRLREQHPVPKLRCFFIPIFL